MMASPYYQGTVMNRPAGYGGVRLPASTGGDLGTGIANAVASLVTAAMYDPEKDPDAQRARLYGEQAKALANTREGQVALADVMATLADPNADPKTKAGVIASTTARFGLDPEVVGKTARLAASLSGRDSAYVDSTHIAAGGRPDQTMGAFMADLTAQGERNRYTTNTQAATARRGQDLNFKADTYRTDQQVATDRYKFDNTPETVIGEGGVPTYAPRSKVAGQQAPISETDAKGTLLTKNFDRLPSMPPEQQAVLGAEPKVREPMNYAGAEGARGRTIDGRTDMTTGQALPADAAVFRGQVQADSPSGLTTPTQGQLQQAGISLRDFRDTTGMLREIAQQDPTIFGATGNLRRAWQAVTGQVKAFSSLGGGDLDRQVESARQNATAMGLGGIVARDFDPNLTDIDKMANLAAYSAAAALANQEGRSVSDKDYTAFKGIIGDPTAWFSTQQTFLAGLDRIDALVGQKLNRVSTELGGGAPTAANSRPSGQQADPLQQARDAISRGAPRDKVIERLRGLGIDPAGL